MTVLKTSVTQKSDIMDKHYLVLFPISTSLNIQHIIPDVNNVMKYYSLTVQYYMKKVLKNIIIAAMALGFIVYQLNL